MEHQNFKFRQFLLQAGRNGLGFPHRVDDHARTAALPQGVLQRFRKLFLRQRLNLDPPRLYMLRNAVLLHFLSVRPGQQRIAAAGFPGGIRQAFLVQVRCHKLSAPLCGQRGRKQDHRHPIPPQPVQRPVEITIHIRIISVALVNHHHFARKAQMPQHHMFLLQSCHQQLVHRTNDKIGQKRLFVALKPLVHHHPAFLIVGVVLHWHRLLLQLQVVCIQLRHAMGQPNGVFQAIRLFLGPVQQSAEDAIGSRLRGQAEEDAALPTALCQNFCRRQSGLGFAHAHLGFQHKNPRFLCIVHCFQHSLLHFVRKKAKSFPKYVRVRRGLLHFPGKGR